MWICFLTLLCAIARHEVLGGLLSKSICDIETEDAVRKPRKLVSTTFTHIKKETKEGIWVSERVIQESSKG